MKELNVPPAIVRPAPGVDQHEVEFCKQLAMFVKAHNERDTEEKVADLAKAVEGLKGETIEETEANLPTWPEIANGLTAFMKPMLFKDWQAQRDAEEAKPPKVEV